MKIIKISADHIHQSVRRDIPQPGVSVLGGKAGPTITPMDAAHCTNKNEKSYVHHNRCQKSVWKNSVYVHGVKDLSKPVTEGKA